MIDVEKSKRDFLTEYGESLDVDQACMKAKRSKSTYTRWYDGDSVFKAAIDAINKKATDTGSVLLLRPDVETQKERLRAALRAQGKGGAMIDPQLEVTVLAWAQMMRVWDQMNQDNYKIEKMPKSREGHDRYIANPLEDLFMKCRAEYQRSLQACGLNFDSKDFSMDEVAMEKDYDQRRMERHRRVAARAES